MPGAMVFLAALALQAPPVADWNCEEPTRQQEMNWCAAREFEAADDALNAAWSRARARTRAQDADFAEYEAEGDDRPGFFASLLEAQRAWLAFRDAHCRLDGYAARGGTLEPLLVSTCKTALTKARTAQLEAIAQGPE